MRKLPLHEEALKASAALVIGMGGGDFILGLPIINYLRSLGVKKFYLGSLCVQWWAKEGYIAIGPDVYTINSLHNAEFVQPAAAIINDKTRLKTHIFEGMPVESKIARLVDAIPFEVSLELGVEGLAESLNNLAARFAADIVVAVDCGGDSIVSGSTKLPPLTPLHDWAMLAALEKVKIPSYLALGGYGCDGEVSMDDLNNTLAKIFNKGGLLGSYALSFYDAELLKQAFNIHFDPVDILVLKAAIGEFGQFRILGFRIVEVTPLAALILFLDPHIVCQEGPASKLQGTRTLNEIEEKMEVMGYIPETKFVHYQKLYRDGG
jgi:hypothetical protein